MSRYLFSVSIGPVQEFIAAARKTRDLWFGSEILSEVSKAAARCAQRAGAQLIFPAPKSDDQLAPGSTLSVANKLLFLAESRDPSELIAALRAAVLDCLRDHRQRAIRAAAAKDLVIDEEACERQIDAFPEFYAAWVPCPEDAPYQACRERVEQLLAARKGLRNFLPHSGSSAFKNTIDGVRETVIDAASIPQARGYQVKPSERLDAIGLLKRFGRSSGSPSFDSTHDLAAAPYARTLLSLRAKDGRIAADLDAYIRVVEKFNPCSQPFFADFGHASIGYLLSAEKDEREPEELTAIRTRLHRAVKPRPPYYAVLLADGDHMGKALDACSSPDQHRELSQRLSTFAARAHERLGKVYDERFSSLGAVVYAGGDDLLALLPLDTALDAARDVRNAFLDAGLQHPISLSAGLVIAHAQEDLTAVIEQAHRTLDYAKNKCDRNALALTLMRRSGAPFTTGGKWDEALGLAATLLDAYAAAEVPFGLGYEWRELANRCRRAGLDGDLVPQWARAVLKQKAEKTVGHLDRIIDHHVRDAASLERLAHQLVLAKALHDGGAKPASLTREAQK